MRACLPPNPTQPLSPSALPELPETPGVSYIMPVLNEADYLERSVRAILAQEYPGTKELVLALGPSTDHTNEIAQRLAAADPRVRLVANPQREIPIGLNLAVAATTHPVIIRVDAHSDLAPDYTGLSIAALRRVNAANVGGVMCARGRTPVQRAIAASYNSPYGLGGGAYHGSGTPGPAESAYLGVFRRESITAVGGYNPAIRRGEDWELNLRIRRAGGLIWFDPDLNVTYWPRTRYRDLAQQFFATGAWRASLVRRYPRETPWRFFIPGLLVVGLACSLMVLLHTLMLWWRQPLNGDVSWWMLAHLTPISYLFAVSFACLRLPHLPGIRERVLGFWALVTMHLSWGTGFIVGMVGGAGRVVDRSRV